MTRWRKTTLGAVADILVGFAFKSADFSGNPLDARLLRGVNVSPGYLDWDSTAYWPIEKAAGSLYRLEGGDVVLAMDRPWIEAGLKRARVRQRDLPALLVQRVARIRGTAEVQTSFIHHLSATEAFSSYLSNVVTGATVPHISQSQISAFEFLLPPIAEQEQICEVLDGVDDLIDTTFRRIELLQSLAEAIYKEWFIRFHYPGHKAETRSGGSPQHWKSLSLDELADIVRGRSYRSSELVDSGGVAFVNLKCMKRGGGFRRDGLKRYTGRHTLEQQVSEGDIVLAVTDLTQGREILARATLVPPLGEEFGVISLDILRLVPKDPEDRLALFFALRCSDFADRVKEFANGSTVLHLSPSHVAQGQLLWPPKRLRSRFADIVAPMIGQIDDYIIATDRLQDLRKLLLPRLVTGRIAFTAPRIEAAMEFVP